MVRSLLLAAGLLFAVSRIAPMPAAAAGSICGDRSEIASSLSQRFSEEPRSLGVDADGGILEVFVSETGSWTIIVTNPRGRTCVLTAGENWETMAPPIKGQPT
ncbi:MAG: hypothetical protein CMM61_13385 [Rhodospirillaceae bacterium]|nr:hypothetical protein [Rhodospirillaceae bacterium]